MAGHCSGRAPRQGFRGDVAAGALQVSHVLLYCAEDKQRIRVRRNTASGRGASHLGPTPSCSVCLTMWRQLGFLMTYHLLDC